MASLQVALVDDEPHAIAILLAYLRRYEQENDCRFDVRVFEDGAALLESYRPIYDIIFLDIRMVGVDGMAAAGAIREIDRRVVLIFITNLAQYAVEGYRVNAMSYLLKPVTYFAFAEELTRATRRLAGSQLDSILVGMGAGVRRVPLNEIVYVESKKHQNVVHTLYESFSYVGTLKELDEQLKTKGFFRINSYYLANLAYVVEVSGHGAKMSTGETLKVARSRKKDFMDALTDYLGSVVL